MSRFHYGFLSGTGVRTEYQFWNEIYKQHAELETRKIDEIIGPETQSTDFRNAPFFCKYRVNPECGFTLCGFDENEMIKLASLFIGYFSSINPEFGKILLELVENGYPTQLNKEAYARLTKSLKEGLLIR